MKGKKHENGAFQNLVGSLQNLVRMTIAQAKSSTKSQSMRNAQTHRAIAIHFSKTSF
jgi:hypothetical protein